MDQQTSRLRKLRQDHQMSMADLAQALNVSRQYIHQLERGNKKVSTRMIEAYTRYFGVSADYILKGEQNRRIPVFSLEGMKEGTGESMVIPHSFLEEEKDYFAMMIPEMKESRLIILEKSESISFQKTGLFFYRGKYHYSRLQMYPDGSTWMISSRHEKPQRISALKEVTPIGYHLYSLVRES